MNTPARKAKQMRRKGFGGWLVGVALAAALLACAEPEPQGPQMAQQGVGGTGRGIGGTGAPERGIGGTGRSEGGIGGTGSPQGGISGTGIVGTVTGFGSVWVNGLEVQFAPQTPVAQEGQPTSAGTLAVGQVVAIHADAGPKGYQARQIQIVHAVSGIAQAVPGKPQQLLVVGQRVEITPQTRLSDVRTPGKALSAPLGAGAYVHVSGLRRADGVIVASRLEQDTPSPQVVLHGEVSVANGVVRVGGIRVKVPQALDKEVLVDGHAVRLEGTWKNGTLVAQQVTADPVETLRQQVEQLVLETYVEPGETPGTYRAGNLMVTVAAAGGSAMPTAAGLSAGPVVVSGAMQGPGTLTAGRMEASPGLSMPSPTENTQEPHEVKTPVGGTPTESESQAGTADAAGGAQAVEHPEIPDLPEKAETPERLDRPELPEKLEHLGDDGGSDSGANDHDTLP